MSSDSELVRRTLVLKDRGSYGQLVQKYQTEIRTYLLRLTRNKELADDLAQESFLLGFRNLNQLNESAHYRAWVYKIAYREFLKWARRKKENCNEVPDVGYSDITVSARSEVNSLLSQVRPEEQAALILCLGQEFTHHEAAEILQMPVGTIKSLILRAREKLGEHREQ